VRTPTKFASRSGAFEKPAMAKISATDGVKLYVEAVGSGTPVVFLHEYAGDYRRTADAR
jgi:hypothetical protein